MQELTIALSITNPYSELSENPVGLKFVLELQDHVADLHIRLGARYTNTRSQFKSPISVLRLQTTPTGVSPFLCFGNTYCVVSNFQRGRSMLR